MHRYAQPDEELIDAESGLRADGRPVLPWDANGWVSEVRVAELAKSSLILVCRDAPDLLLQLMYVSSVPCARISRGEVKKIEK